MGAKKRVRKKSEGKERSQADDPHQTRHEPPSPPSGLSGFPTRGTEDPPSSSPGKITEADRSCCGASVTAGPLSSGSLANVRANLHKMVQSSTSMQATAQPLSDPNFHAAVGDVLQGARVLLQVAQCAQKTPADESDSSLELLQLQLKQLALTVQQIQSCVAQVGPKNSDVAVTKPQEFAIKPKTFNALQPTKDATVQAAKAPASAQPSVWSGFYNKTLRERSDVLTLMYPRLTQLQQQQQAAAASVSSSDHESGPKLGEVPMRVANIMIENCIGVMGVPLGLGLNFVIDGQSLSVPMAVEEPSVVAAASSAAKLVASFGGGFRTATSGNIMTSQIQLVDTRDLGYAIRALEANRERLLDLANTTCCPNMKKRGGGAVDIYCRVVSQAARSKFTRSNDKNYWYQPCADELTINASDESVQYLVVHIDVDVCEAMGANIVNTVAEGLSDEICRLTRSRSGLRILTNLCMQRRSRSSFEIPLIKMGYKGVSGEDVAKRIVEAYNFAAVDPYRAVTNNKGIMNGVDAVALATGQDWRAIEAGAHCYASRSGQYASLSHYEIATNDEGVKVLRGSLEFPISVGSKGGALQTHPGYSATHAILHQPSASALSSIILSVGLAQNFAAIRAIAITGIQKGHMALHARNIAVAAGAPSELVSECCTYMLERKSINVETGKQYLQAHAVFSEIQNNSPFAEDAPAPVASPVALPSMFYVEIPVPHLDRTISLNLAFESINQVPQYIAIMPSNSQDNSSITTIQQQLLGDKGYNQLEKMFLFLASLRSIVVSEADDVQGELVSRANLALQNKLQLISVLLNIISYRLVETRSPVVREFMRKVLACGDVRTIDASECKQMLADVPRSDDILCTGLPLFLSLWQVLHYHIDQDVAHPVLREALVKEQWRLLNAIMEGAELSSPQAQSGNDAEFSESMNERFSAFMAVNAKRWQGTMLLLIDSLALSSEVVTPSRLQFLTRIGDSIEWEGTIAHDIARYKRAASERVPNAFIYWMQQKGLDIAHGDLHVDEFRVVADQYAAAKWKQIVQERDTLAASLFSLTAVERVIQLIRKVYGQRAGQATRKESF